MKDILLEKGENSCHLNSYPLPTTHYLPPITLVFQTNIDVQVPLQLLTNLIHIHYYSDQPSRGALKKRCSQNIHQIFRRTPMSKCDFKKVEKQLH